MFWVLLLPEPLKNRTQCVANPQHSWACRSQIIPSGFIYSHGVDFWFQDFFFSNLKNNSFRGLLFLSGSSNTPRAPQSAQKLQVPTFNLLVQKIRPWNVWVYVLRNPGVSLASVPALHQPAMWLTRSKVLCLSEFTKAWKNNSVPFQGQWMN